MKAVRAIPYLSRRGANHRSRVAPLSAALSVKAGVRTGSERQFSAEATLKHTPFGQRGSGFYTDATRGCFDVLARLEKPLLAAVEVALSRRQVAGDFTTPFRIADFGTADAGTSMPLVRTCIAKVRATRGFETTPVEVLYEDQPNNDWASVFNRTQGVLSTPNVPDAACGLSDLQNVIVLASGVSFYKPCFSAGSLDVAFCSTAFHWLTATPCIIPDALHSAASEDAAAVEAYRAMADVNWRQIIEARGRELKPGGRMIIANFAKDDEGQYLGTTHRTQSMHHNFADIWKGLVTPEEFAATNFPNQYRSLEECTAPFGSSGSGIFAGLKILDAETAVVPCPYLDSHLADPTKRTSLEQAMYFHNTTRTWSNSTFVAGLSAHRSDEEKSAIVDALFDSYAQRIAENPEKHGMDYVHSYLTLEKQEAVVGGGGSGGALNRSNPARASHPSMSGWSAALPDSTAAAQMLPNERGCSEVLMRSHPDFDIYIGAALGKARPLSPELPGNGGMRIWNYESSVKAQEAAVALSQGMEVKHRVYNTGFAGAKVVVNAKSDAVIQDKEKLMELTATFLNDLNGSMYTGCDINSTTMDMDNMAKQCPYVLAGIGNRELNPNEATAHGVLGALQSVADAKYGGLKNTRFVVHGCGNVGSVVARELVAAGAKVSVCDNSPGRSSTITGATDISEAVMALGSNDWSAALPVHDIFVPCSMSQIITTAVSTNLPATAIVGATNQPFATAEAEAAFASRGHLFVPECITSAGAILADSVEHFAQAEFAAADPSLICDFCNDAVSEKTIESMKMAAMNKTTVAKCIPDLISSSDTGAVIGNEFKSWLAKKQSSSMESAGKGFMESAELLHGMLRAQPSTKGPSSARMFSSTSQVTKPVDVCIVGSGIMGMNAAYQMKRRDPSLNIVILERAPALGYGSSGWSTGFLRAFYSFDSTMELALDGINSYKNWGEYTGLGDKAEAFFTHTGALWMLGKTREGNQGLVDRLNKFNVGCEMMDETDIKRRFPALSTEPFPEFDMESGEQIKKDWGELTAVYEHGCGHMDSSACLRDMQAACESQGIEIRFNSRVKEFTKGSGDKLDGVTLMDGSMLPAGAVLNCAGPWFQQLNGPAGVKTSTEMLPTRIQVGHKALPDDEDLLSLPFVADMWGNSGIYFMPRRQNKQLVFGSIAHRFESEVVDPDNYNEALDPDVKQDYLNCLFHRLPTMERRGEIQGFSHMYTVNQDDVHPVIGGSKEYSNLYLCNGFSGHGFKLAPAVGSLLAQQVLGTRTDKWETSIPLDFMGPNRTPLKLAVKTHFA